MLNWLKRNAAEVAITVILVILLVAFAAPLYISLSDSAVPTKDKVSLVGGLAGGGGIMLSIAAFYISALRPFGRRPILTIEENVQVSEPAPSESAQTSWFLRLRVQNNGQRPAKNCVGRLVEVRQSDGVDIKLDPLTLYWARQNTGNTFSPVDIQANSDYFFLDVAQVTHHKDQNRSFQLHLRVVVPNNQRLPNIPGQVYTPPDLVPDVSYFLRIGIYAEGDTYVPLKWFKLQPTSDQKSPYTIEKIKDREVPSLKNG